MVNNTHNIGFIHDISSLDMLRKKAVNEGSEGEKEALLAAAKQFESIFTSMMLKSMRDANAGFQSGMLNSQTEQFYRQMQDEQMVSEISASGSLGLADMIVKQLTMGQDSDTQESQVRDATENVLIYRKENESKAHEIEKQGIESGEISRISKIKDESLSFDTPESFITSMKPYAKQAAKILGIEPSLLLAQAALETGWGQKVVANAGGSSNNLFNIKADRGWQGDKIATQTIEYHNNVPVTEKASFRSYSSYQDSFNDYVQFLNNNPRYHSALQNNNGNSEAFIKRIHQAGYATDPDYADKVLRVKQRIDQM